MSGDEPRALPAPLPDSKFGPPPPDARSNLGGSLFPPMLYPRSGPPSPPAFRLTGHLTPAVRHVRLPVIRSQGVGGGISARRFASGKVSVVGSATAGVDCVMRGSAVGKARIRTGLRQRDFSHYPNWC